MSDLRPGEPRLSVRDLRVRRGDLRLSEVSFDVGAGEVLAVVGPSGCGKSTLLLALAGFEALESGSILIDGNAVEHFPPDRRPTGVVFQSPALFERMSVRDNVAFGLSEAPLGERHVRDLVDSTMARMGVASLAERLPRSLSGGQAQRVALARTLARRPAVLLLDEPLAHVGAGLAATIRQALLREIRRLGLSALYVTHDIEEACIVGDRLLLMERGRAIGVGRARELYERPADPRTARLMGIPNVIACRIEEGEHEGRALLRCGSASFLVPSTPGLGPGPALVALPAEAVELAPGPPSTIIGRHAQVIGAAFVRGFEVYDVETEFGTLVVRAPSDARRFEVGDHVDVEFRGGWALPGADLDG